MRAVAVFAAAVHRGKTGRGLEPQRGRASTASDRVAGCRFWTQDINFHFDFAEGPNTKISAKYQNTDVIYFDIFNFILATLNIRESPRTFYEN